MIASLKEVGRSLAAWRTWGPIALEGVVNGYRRTFVGPLWLILPQSLFIAGIYVLHRTAFMGAQPDFLLYLAISLPLWTLIASLINEGANAVVAAKGYLESYALPAAIHIVLPVARCFISYAHMLIIYVVVALFVRHHIPFTAPLALLGLAIIAVFGFGVGLALGPLGARFRDIGPGLASLLTLAFVLTPIFWAPNAAQLRSPMLVYNPLYYLMEVVRQPLLGRGVDGHVVAVSAMLAAGALVVGIIVWVRGRSTLYYWL